MLEACTFTVSRLYTVSEKKVNLCIHFHNFHRQCRILTKFRNSNATSNGMQTTKFQYNLLMSAIVIASLARSPKNTKCPLLAGSQRWDCQSAKIKHVKICVQNILRMLECKLDDVNAIAWPLIDDYLVETLQLFHHTWLQLGDDVMNPAPVHTLLQLPPDPFVYRVDVRTVGYPEIGVMKSGVSPVKAIVCGEYHVYSLRLLRQQTSLPDQWSH